MSKIYLPIGFKPTEPKSKREEYMHRIWDARYVLPGAEKMDLTELKDFVDFAEERYQEDLLKETMEILKGKEIVSKMEKEHVKGALNEFLDWRRRRRVRDGQEPKQTT